MAGASQYAYTVKAGRLVVLLLLFDECVDGQQRRRSRGRVGISLSVNTEIALGRESGEYARVFLLPPLRVVEYSYDNFARQQNSSNDGAIKSRLFCVFALEIVQCFNSTRQKKDNWEVVVECGDNWGLLSIVIIVLSE